MGANVSEHKRVWEQSFGHSRVVIIMHGNKRGGTIADIFIHFLGNIRYNLTFVQLFKNIIAFINLLEFTVKLHSKCSLALSTGGIIKLSQALSCVFFFTLTALKKKLL